MEASEPLINSILAKIISEKVGEWLSIALGEAVKKCQKRIWKPDVYLIEHFGLKIVIEAKIGHRKHLEVVRKCEERLNEGLADICFAITYGEDIKQVKDINELENKLRKAKLKVTIKLPSGEVYGPVYITVDELVSYMEKHRIYDHLVERELVEEVAKYLKKALNDCINQIGKTKPEILANIASIAEKQLELYGSKSREEGEEYE